MSADWQRLLGGLRHWYRLVARASPRARVIELDDVLATVVPSVPERSVMNGVVYETAAGLEAALPELAAAYDAAGIDAWCVWVPLGEATVVAALDGAGHRLDASPQAMIRELRGIERPPPSALEAWTADGAAAVAAELNDRSYQFGTDSFARGLSELPADEARVYLASLDGRPVACVVTSDEGGNCEVDLVATVPEARRRGISSALIGHALADAAERGCATSTLVATALGRPVYERLGFRSLGTIEMWERRRPG